jgi:hypothetical protein
MPGCSATDALLKKWSRAPVLPRVSPDPKSGGFAVSLARVFIESTDDKKGPEPPRSLHIQAAPPSPSCRPWKKFAQAVTKVPHVSPVPQRDLRDMRDAGPERVHKTVQRNRAASMRVSAEEGVRSHDPTSPPPSAFPSQNSDTRRKRKNWHGVSVMLRAVLVLET